MDLRECTGEVIEKVFTVESKFYKFFTRRKVYLPDGRELLPVKKDRHEGPERYVLPGVADFFKRELTETVIHLQLGYRVDALFEIPVYEYRAERREVRRKENPVVLEKKIAVFRYILHTVEDYDGKREEWKDEYKYECLAGKKEVPVVAKRK